MPLLLVQFIGIASHYFEAGIGIFHMSYDLDS